MRSTARGCSGFGVLSNRLTSHLLNSQKIQVSKSQGPCSLSRNNHFTKYCRQHPRSYSTNSPVGLSVQNEASTILPDEYFQREVFKSHNDKKVAQLGSDIPALKREIFLDTIEKDLNQLNKLNDVSRVISILDEFIPKRGITSYGLLHACRCLRDAGKAEKGLEYIEMMRSMGSPPSLRNLPIVTEIVKTSIASKREDAIIEAITDYATIFPEDKALWMLIFDFATNSNLQKLHFELTNIFDRYYSQFNDENAMKIKIIRFFEKWNDYDRADKVRKSIRTSTKFTRDIDLFHTLKDLVDANDISRAHSLFQRTLQSGPRFDFHINTVTLALQCAIKLEDWNTARKYLQWFFPKTFGSLSVAKESEIAPKVNSLDVDAHIVDAGITVLSHFDFQSASSLFHQFPPNTYILSSYLNAMQQTGHNEDVLKTFKKFFRPFKLDGMYPKQMHVEPLIRALSNIPNQEVEVEKLYKMYFSNVDGSLYLGRPVDTLVEAIFTALLPAVENSDQAREFVAHLLVNYILKFDYKKKSIIHHVDINLIPTLVGMIEEVVQELPQSEVLSAKCDYFIAQAALRSGKSEEVFSRLASGQNVDSLIYGCSHDSNISVLNTLLQQMQEKDLTCSFQGLTTIISCYVKEKHYEKALDALVNLQSMGMDISKLNARAKDELFQHLRTIKRFTKGDVAKKAQCISLGLELSSTNPSME